VTDTDFHPRLTATATVSRDHDGKPLELTPYDRAHVRFRITGENGRLDTDIGFARVNIVSNVHTFYDLREAAGGPVPTAPWYSALTAGVDRKHGDIGTVLIAGSIRGRRDVVIIRDLVLADNWTTDTIVRTALHAITNSFIARAAALIVADTPGWYTELPEGAGLHRWAETNTGIIIPA
jgi:hypothetical protein